MVFGTRVLEYWVLGPFGFGAACNLSTKAARRRRPSSFRSYKPQEPPKASAVLARPHIRQAKNCSLRHTKYPQIETTRPFGSTLVTVASRNSASNPAVVATAVLVVNTTMPTERTAERESAFMEPVNSQRPIGGRSIRDAHRPAYLRFLHLWPAASDNDETSSKSNFHTQPSTNQQDGIAVKRTVQNKVKGTEVHSQVEFHVLAASMTYCKDMDVSIILEACIHRGHQTNLSAHIHHKQSCR